MPLITSSGRLQPYRERLIVPEPNIKLRREELVKLAKFDLSEVHLHYQESFVSELADLFDASLEKLPPLCGPENTRAFFRSAIDASKSAGFQLRGEIVKYCFLTLHIGLFFDIDPLYDDIRADMLWNHAGVHPNVGLNRMFRSTDLMVAESLCAVKDGVTPGFGAACQASKRACNTPPLSAAFDICRTANPLRFQAFGASRVHAVLSAAEQDPRLDGHSDAFTRDWLICTYYLGWGFDRNPLFSWVPAALMRCDLPEIGSLLDG